MTTLIEALSDKSQDDARANLKVDDEVVITYQCRIIPFHARKATVTKTTPKYITVGALKFHREGGKQVGGRECQRMHYGLYAMTPEVKEAMDET